MKLEDYNNIPKELLEFSPQRDDLHDQKLNTKPVGYLKDAFYRFRKNKGSIVAFFIIMLLLLFAIIVPFVSKYEVKVPVADNYPSYQLTLPKNGLSTALGIPFWDGCKEQKSGYSDYIKNLAIEAETGTKVITSDVEVITEIGTDGKEKQYYKYREDSYFKAGCEFYLITPERYRDIQNYQNETGIQIIYPMMDLSKNKRRDPSLAGFINDANLWYEFNRVKGVLEPVYEDDGVTFKNIYSGFLNTVIDDEKTMPYVIEALNQSMESVTSKEIKSIVHLPKSISIFECSYLANITWSIDEDITAVKLDGNMLDYQNPSKRTVVKLTALINLNGVEDTAEYELTIIPNTGFMGTDIKVEPVQSQQVPKYDENGEQIIVPYDDYYSLRLDSDVDYAYSYAEKADGAYRVRMLKYEYYKYYHKYILKDDVTEPYFVFGTNETGQDILVCLASGARFSLLLAVIVASINLIVGAIIGAIEGYYGGVIDLVIERFIEILGSIPFMIVITLLKYHLDVSHVVILFISFFLTGWTGMAARTRMQFYRFKNQEYVMAARTLGASDKRIMFKHIFPNAIGTLITSCVLVIPGVIFSETSLSYLGIINLDSGDMSSVGTLLAQGNARLFTHPHVILFPAIFISLLMLSFNLFGNGLRDAFNPSLRGTEE